MIYVLVILYKGKLLKACHFTIRVTLQLSILLYKTSNDVIITPPLPLFTATSFLSCHWNQCIAWKNVPHEKKRIPRNPQKIANALEEVLCSPNVSALSLQKDEFSRISDTIKMFDRKFALLNKLSQRCGYLDAVFLTGYENIEEMGEIINVRTTFTTNLWLRLSHKSMMLFKLFSLEGISYILLLRI